MKDELSDHLSELFERAVELPCESRQQFVDACSTDPELRSKLRSLLAAYERSPNFLEQIAADLSPAALCSGVDDSAIEGCLWDSDPAKALSRSSVGMGVTRMQPGTRLGPYQIEACIGAGGISVVYRALDTTLNRSVALKTLSRHTSNARESLLREARAASALNHPHICTIYEVAEHDGVPFIAMEYIEGGLLREQIPANGMLPEPTMRNAIQIARALEHAHRRGIIHCDLKSANVMGTPDGLAKVLDFGLSGRLTRSDSDLTPSLATSANGPIAGTLPYLAPELINGGPANTRTDVWAFGVLLYEMVSGRLPFVAPSRTQLVAEILQTIHPPLPPHVPPPLRVIVDRCLEKNTARRYQDAGEIRAALEAVKLAAYSAHTWRRIVLGVARVPERTETTPAGTKPLDISEAQLETAPALSLPTVRGLSRINQSSGRRLIVLGIGGLLVVGLILWLTFSHSALNVPEQLTRLTFDEGLQLDPTLSPDGQWFMYASNKAGNFDLYTQPVNGGNPVQVTQHPAHDWQPDWSVNGRIVFRSERDGGGLYVVAPTGGNEQRIAEFGDRPLWSPDGRKILFAQYPSRKLYTVGLDGSSPRSCDQCYGVTYGWFGDASHVSVFSTGSGPQYEPFFRTIDLESHISHRWLAAPAVAKGFSELGLSVVRGPLAWDPDGNAFYFAGSSRGTAAVWKVEIDRATSSLTAGPQRVVMMAESASSVSIARETGAMAFAAATQTPRILWYSLDPSGRRIIVPPGPLTSRDLTASGADVTPDGSRLIFSVSRTAGSTIELRTKMLPDGAERTLRISNAARHEEREGARWSPDGQRIVFRYVLPHPEGAPENHPLLRSQQLRLLDVNTGEESELTTIAARFVRPGGFSPDGAFVVANVSQLQQNVQTTSIVLLPVAMAPTADAQMRIVTTHVGPAGLNSPVMSPNGRWIAFQVLDQSARITIVGSNDGLWNEPQPEGQWHYLDPIAMYEPRWSADGRLLYFVSMDGGFANVWAVDFDPITAHTGKPFPVTDFSGQGELMPLAPTMSAVVQSGLAVRTVNPTGGVWLLRQKR